MRPHSPPRLRIHLRGLDPAHFAPSGPAPRDHHRLCSAPLGSRQPAKRHPGLRTSGGHPGAPWVTLRSRIVTPTQGAEGAVPQRPESQRGPLSSGETEAAAGQLQGSSDDGKGRGWGRTGTSRKARLPPPRGPSAAPPPLGRRAPTWPRDTAASFPRRRSSRRLSALDFSCFLFFLTEKHFFLPPHIRHRAAPRGAGNHPGTPHGTPAPTPEPASSAALRRLPVQVICKESKC